MRHIFGRARPTNFKVGTRMEDDDHWAKARSCTVCTSHLCLSLIRKQNAVPVLLEAGGGILCRPNPAATRLVLFVPGNDCNQPSYTKRRQVLEEELSMHQKSTKYLTDGAIA